MRITGVDRGLVSVDGTVGSATWLGALAQQRTVPVVLAIAPEASGGVRDIDPAALSVALAEAIGADSVVVLASQSPEVSEVSVKDAQTLMSDPKPLSRMASGGVPVVLALRSALRSSGVPEGARLVEQP